MPSAISIKKRQEIIKRHEQGTSLSQIARDLGIHEGTARNIWHRYQKSGELKPNYEACSHQGIRKDERIYERAIEYKSAHRTWGAGLIWVELAEEFEEADLPSERTLQRWFHRAGLVEKVLRDCVVGSNVKRGQARHEVWALDAKEQMLLLDGSYGSWVVVTDEGSGAMLEAQTFPPQEME